MVAYVEVPPEVTRIDEMLKSLATGIVHQCAESGRTQQCDNTTDLFTSLPEGWVFIRKGVFKYYFNKRLIRLYSSGDLLPIAAIAVESGCSCISEFGSEITLFETEPLSIHVRKHPEAAELFLRYQTLHTTMMHLLCAVFMTEDLHPDLSIRSYHPGEVIIAQGEPAREIYQMIQGTAIVTVKDTEVGTIDNGEIFGEISFFTESTRSATVKAKTECLVQVMGKEEFITLVKIKPSVNLAISKTLSQRLMQTNRKIAGE
jgi:CRP/FNR family transcriptional regulator, cyclic AMP receptor protein